MKARSVFIVIIVVATVIIPGWLQAQNNRVQNLPVYDYSKYHFGFVLGVNQMHFTVKPLANLHRIVFDSTFVEDISADSAILYSVEHEPVLGFTVGIVSNLRLGEYFDLRFIPSLSFGERYLDYRILKFRKGEETLIDIRKDIQSTFVDLPFHVKYKSKRSGNFRAYLLSGINPRIDLASQAKKERETNQVIVKLKRGDVYFDIGVGFDWYFEWFKLGTELKMSYGLTDVLKREHNIYSDGIDRLTSKIFQFSFTFE
ncbi:MAG: PorT family protein [Bacteroidales bacterium]|nr:PorT family protein [Bacteroidales bacterium]